MSEYLVVGDADSIIAQANPKDLKHHEATVISQRLIQSKTRLIYPVTAVAEALTFIQRVLHSPATAYGAAVEFANSSQLVDVDQDIYFLAIKKYFNPKASKKNTLFDCLVASVAETYHADAIFSFDKFYKSKGFRLASEL